MDSTNDHVNHPVATLPSTTLLDILANPIILDSLVPYLSLETIFRLSRTSKLFRHLILQTPGVFRYLDLSRSRGAYSRLIAPIDNGGHSWRAERMDENLTEDEFYSGPLRGVLNTVQRMNVLQDVQTLVLDGLASVTNDLVYEIITNAKFNVRLLSIRQCPNVNHSKLQQLLTYICRPTRPEGTPRLEGLYVFTDHTVESSDELETISITSGVTDSDGAALGLLPLDKSRASLKGSDFWYAPSGRVIQTGASKRSSWEETLQVCKGIIAFDAVLCSAMHEAVASCLHDASREFLERNKPGVPTIATIALGPEGCSGCGKAPENSPVWGEADIYEFPLLSPPPFSGKLIDAIRPPKRSSKPETQRLIASCTWCLANRHCDSCHKWWCVDCYNPKRTNRLRDLEALSNTGLNFMPSYTELDSGEQAKGDSVKVFNGFCVQNCLVPEMMAGAGSNGMWA